MRDIPMFTTDLGVAALTLREIPYKGEAFIRILDTQSPMDFLDECCQFCKAAGAEHIYAAGHDILNVFPLHTAILKLRYARDNLSDTDAALFPVQPQNVERWREIFNTHMRDVPNAATMTSAKAQELLAKGGAYFVHRDEQLLGIGIASGETIDAIVSVVKGEGETVLLALNHALSGECVEVVVASVNLPAMKLYKRLGFVEIEEISRWYKIV